MIPEIRQREVRWHLGVPSWRSETWGSGSEKALIVAVHCMQRCVFVSYLGTHSVHMRELPKYVSLAAD